MEELLWAPQPVPAVLQVWAGGWLDRCVTADHPPTRLAMGGCPGPLGLADGRAPPGLAAACKWGGRGSGAVGCPSTRWEEERVLMDNGSRWGCCWGCWRQAQWHGWPVLGESKPSLGLGPRQDGEGAQDPCASAHEAHVLAPSPSPSGTPLLLLGLCPAGGSGFTTQKQPDPPRAGESGGANAPRLIPSHHHQLREQASKPFPLLLG